MSSDHHQPSSASWRYDPSSVFVSPADARVKVAVLDEVLDLIESLPPTQDVEAELRRNRNKLARAAADAADDPSQIRVHVPYELKTALFSAPHDYSQRLPRSGNRLKKRQLGKVTKLVKSGGPPIYEFDAEPEAIALLHDAAESQIGAGAHGSDSKDLKGVLEAHMKRTDGAGGDL